MRLLVATSRGQGVRRTDFHNAGEDEVVTFASECDGEKVDGRCGCRRAMCGITSHMASTTFLVKDFPELDRDGVMALVRESLTSGGWLDLGATPDNDQWVAEDADELIRTGAFFREGDVVEKRGRKFQTRIPAFTQGVTP